MKHGLLLLLLYVSAMLTPSVCGGAEAERSPITVHVLDTSRGKPAAGVAVMLEQAEGQEWRELAMSKTDDDGRIQTLLP